MKTILKPIALNEKSYNVNLLHKALEVLGLPVSKDETSQVIAGRDTLKQVRNLQEQLNVPVDKSTLVNEATAVAIAEALKKLGHTAASRSFTVTGLVKLQNGAVKKRQQLLAFDLDLRGVAVYRTVKSVEEIKKTGGFEFLGQAVSDNLGNYSITFYDWQYGQAERKKADVVVYALEGEDVIGHSRLVNSEDYSDKGLVRDLDIIITQEEKRTEYEAFMNGLNAFLKESKTSLAEIAKSRDQLVFTAGELDVDQSRIDIAASAELLRKEKGENSLSHELLYGIGRQGIRLDWAALYKKQEEELRRAIAKSVDERIIRKYRDEEVTAFLKAIQEYTVRFMLEDKGKDDKNTLNTMLKNALPEEKQRISFLNALRNFKGTDFRDFWNKHLPEQPEFKDSPELVSGLLLTQQLTLLTGNHQALVHELQVNRKLTSAHKLIEYERSDWLNVIKKTGVPDSIEGKDAEKKIERYADLIENRLNKSLPTRRIAKMVEKGELPIEKTRVSKSISAFLSKNQEFDFAGKRIHDFKNQIEEVAGKGKDYDEVRNELKKIQRVFQVSTSPKVMTVLMEKNLHSAYTIANIPRKSFVKTYGNALGGEDVASAIHQRASHISTRSEMIAMHMMEYSHGLMPQKIMGPKEYKAAMTVIKNHLPNPTPNYAALFGSPDICECGHCRSVYSAAAYFVELLRFLWRGEPNSDGKTPLDMLVARRPDLLHLPLTCENTNTNIPYIDLANEVMEYYTANDSLDNFKGHDTGNTTEKELRANPQNFNLKAYRILSNNKEVYPVVPIPIPPPPIPPHPETRKAVYPFTLPYHQPLDVIRTYSGHLKVSRYEAMKAMNPQPDAVTSRAIEAESLKISQEEYMILTHRAFDGTLDTTDLHKYFGYENAVDFANMQYETDADGNPRGIRVLLERTGLAYTDLVELVKTQFINPYQGTIDFLEKIFSYASIKADIIYTRLEQIEGGTLDPANDADIVAALNSYNSANKMSITTNEFAQWVTDHFGEFQQAITLYEPDSKCDLDTTRLKTIQNVYERLAASGITSGTWSKIHRFIRLWRKLGWTMHETDLMLAALGEGDITPETISKLESVSLLHAATKLPLNQLAVLWGNIDTYGKKSLYKKLFLNKAVQLIDEAFKADAWGNYLQDDTEILADHQSAMLAAFRMTEEDLDAILEVARVISGGNPRHLNMISDMLSIQKPDILNIQNLSTLYRYVVLAKALKMRITDLCKLIRLFNASPFSTWNIQREEFTNISPEDTYEFYKLAASTKEAGFKSSALEYILEGTLPADSTLGLDNNKTLQTAKAIRDAFAAIEQDHPETPALPLTAEIITAKLSLTFQPEIVSQFMGIIEGTAPFETKTDANLNVTIPDDESQGMVIALVATGVFASQDEAKAFLREFSRKYAYVKGNGRLTCTGVMSDIEREVLKGLPNVNANFETAVDELYAMPEIFIYNNFNGETYERLENLPAGIVFPNHLIDRISYDVLRKYLILKGIISLAEKEDLLRLSRDINYQNAVEMLYQKSQKPHGIFDNLIKAHSILLDHPAQATAATLEEKLAYVYERFIPILKSKLRKDAITQHIAALIGLSEEATALLIAADIDTLIKDLSTEGLSATYFSDVNWNTPVLERVDNAVDFSWGIDAPDQSVPANNFSVRWTAYIAAPASGEYTLVVEVEEADEAFNLYLDNTLMLEKAAANANTSWEVVTNLNASQMHLLTLEYAEVSQNAGVRLHWKTAATAREIIPASAAYPAAILDAFVEQTTVFHRAAKFILGFGISETELNHFISFNADFGNIDFKSLTADHWERIRDYAVLRNAVPQAQALLTDVFALANRLDPLPTVDQLTEMLQLATAWDQTSLEYLVTTHFTLGVDDFKNEIALNRLHEVIKIVVKTGISAETIAEWGDAETDFDTLHTTAQLIKNTVKAKYEEEDWLDLAGGLSDKIRKNQQQALVSYLLMQPAIQAWGARDADGLFEYFLIDVQMGACMDTSRIVQANAAIQMFINRCLLNLESDTSSGSEKGVSPGAIDKDRWEWMKNYRVWEANRKVFLYPENWLEPEWRNDRSEFFKELESYLVQNDITERSVEQALRNYLMNLNEVANLDVRGMHQENDNEDKLKYLHVFARTHNAPYKFFYRTWNEYRKWSAWEKVPVDIRSVEEGDNSGVHLIPMVWKKRLFLFWPEFMEKQEPRTGTDNQSVIALGSDPNTASSLKPITYWEIRLAWSEYVDGKWSPKQVSKEFQKFYFEIRDKKELFFALREEFFGKEFQIYTITKEVGVEGIFYLSDMHSPIDQTNDLGGNLAWNEQDKLRNDQSVYKYFFSGRSATANLKIRDIIYLQNSREHRLLPVGIWPNLWLDISLDMPFFYSDGGRTYFVRPVPHDLSDILSDVIGLEFHTSHHPFSSTFVTRLNQGGIPALMGSDTENSEAIKSDEGDTFKNTYNPNFNNGLVQPSLDDLRTNDTYKGRTYYKENVCFDVYGVNSLYNWELFFHAPLYIATRLSKNGKYEEAMKWFHYIFDPTTDDMPRAGEEEKSRYWKVLPFKTTSVERLEDWFRKLNRESVPSSPDYDPYSELSANVSEWRDNPFDPHLVASNRPLAYMKHVVIKYVENLIAWGDSLFRQFTRENVNEALQIYVIANHILGPKPEFVPKRGEIKAESYDSLKDKWDDFSNALVELENIFPYSSDVSARATSTGTNMLGSGPALYFCIPANEKLVEYWDKVADRLFKIRHCQDIDGVERKLALFAPPISPEALIQAVSQGLSLGSILADLSSPPPIYRFTYLIQKCNEFCSDVKALGAALLAAMEKKDAEELSRLRASHETYILEQVTAIRERQILDAKVYKENMKKVRETAKFRLQHYTDLLGNESVTVPAEPTVNANLTADSQLPVDTSIAKIETDVDDSLVDSDESGVKLIPKEAEELAKSEDAMIAQTTATSMEALAGIFHLFPQIDGEGTPMGVGVGAWWGGQNLGSATSALAKVPQVLSQIYSYESSQAAKMAGYIRREQEWTLQANLAAKEIIQLDKQITSADIRIQVAEKELGNHKEQIKNSKAVELFLKNKFTNQELYQWMKEQLFAVYKQSYNLAYDMAKKAERAYKYERGTETATFIQYGYWDNSMQGLVAGEKLQLALRQLEKSYLEENRRELELTKSISLAMLNPLALIELRETGKCYVSLPEELFDLDFQGHYFRRIKSVSLSIPCIAGPYTTVNCSLRLLNNHTRINTSMSAESGIYEHENDEGLWSDDDRFRTSNVPVTSIATSSGQNDAGMFEFNFRDERYLPFEGAGVISDWLIELGGANFEADDDNEVLRQFDYSTISDVILHLRYTAREDGGLKESAVTYIKNFIMNSDDLDLPDQPLMRMFSMKHEFPTEWHKFLHPGVVGGEQVLNITIGKNRFPFFAQDRKIVVMKMEVFAKCTQEGDYHMILSYTKSDGSTVTSDSDTTDQDPETPILMPRNNNYGGLNKATINVTDAGLNLEEELDIEKAMRLKLKYSAAPDYTGLATKPDADEDEVEDIFLVFHYKMG